MHHGGSDRPLIIPVFIPNQGCPHRCIFCQQDTITSQKRTPLGRGRVMETLEKATRARSFDPRRGAEVAFYGGTFTGLPEEKMVELLEAAASYIRQGLVRSIRVSTRPDLIEERHLKLLKHFGVSTVELGAQSMDDRVLGLANRGHSASDTVRSIGLLKEEGFKVGIQLMPGLPGDSEAIFLDTVEKVIELGPDMARLYPALVIRGTELEVLFHEGRYRPLLLEEALKLCEEACFRLEEAGISVIRIGILNAPDLAEKGEIVSGPWHDSFGFLVRCGIYRRRIEPFLPGSRGAGRIRLWVQPRDLPLMRGYRNDGLKFIEGKTGARVMEVLPDDSLIRGEIRVENL